MRIIAATHQNLENLVEQGSFREDLFHRLNVIRIHIPKLSERREDIPRANEVFPAAGGPGAWRRDQSPATGGKVVSSPALTGRAMSGNWRTACRWITVMASGREVHLRDLPPELGQVAPTKESNEQADWPELLFNWARNELSTRQATNPTGRRPDV